MMPPLCGCFCICHIIVIEPHWGSSVGQPKGPGGFASAAIATRNAAPYLLQIRL